MWELAFALTHKWSTAGECHRQLKSGHFVNWFRSQRHLLHVLSMKFCQWQSYVVQNAIIIVIIIITAATTISVASQQHQHESDNRKWLNIINVSVFSSRIVCSVTFRIVIVLSSIGQLCLMTNLCTIHLYVGSEIYKHTHIHIDIRIRVCVCVLLAHVWLLTEFGVIDSHDYGRALVEFRCKAFNECI